MGWIRSPLFIFSDNFRCYVREALGIGGPIHRFAVVAAVAGALIPKSIIFDQSFYRGLYGLRVARIDQQSVLKIADDILRSSDHRRHDGKPVCGRLGQSEPVWFHQSRIDEYPSRLGCERIESLNLLAIMRFWISHRAIEIVTINRFDKAAHHLALFLLAGIEAFAQTCDQHEIAPRTQRTGSSKCFYQPDEIFLLNRPRNSENHWLRRIAQEWFE